MTSEQEKYNEHLEKLNDNYWSNLEFRRTKNQENKARSKVRVISSECKDEFAYGSMFAPISVRTAYFAL